jgi:hypothetical protein
LIIEGRDVKNIPDWIGLFEKIEKIEIQSTKITTLPESLFKLPNLKILILENSLRYGEFIVPDSIGESGNLSKLEELTISHYFLEKIPDSIGQLKSLKELDLSRNKIEIIPESIWYLPQLKILNLGGNLIEKIPESIHNLSNLTYLSIPNNKLKYLPDSIGFLYNLTHLGIGGNEIKNLPDSMKNLSNLTHLDIRDNVFQDFPDVIDELYNLTHLDISNNFVRYLPQSLGDLQNLKYFVAKDASLRYLPDSIGNLLNLEHLDIRDNLLLDSLPFSIIKILNNVQLFLDESLLKLYGISRGNVREMDIYKYYFREDIPISERVKNELIEKIKSIQSKPKQSKYREFMKEGNNGNGNNYDKEFTGKEKVKKMKGKYFDLINNRYTYSDIGELKNSRGKMCSYCKNKPIKSCSFNDRDEAHFVCSNECGNKVFNYK